MSVPTSMSGNAAAAASDSEGEDGEEVMVKGRKGMRRECASVRDRRDLRNDETAPDMRDGRAVPKE